jgi:glutamine synthetase
MVKICVEYVWIDGKDNLRSKIKVYNNHVNSINDVPYWNYDGSSTHQGTTEDSEVTLIPVRLYKCPFKLANYIGNKIILCETYDKHINPLPSNHRTDAKLIFDKYKEERVIYNKVLLSTIQTISIVP